MATAGKDTDLGYEIVHEGDDTTLQVDCEGLSIVPSIEDHAFYMARAIDMLVQNNNVTKMVFAQHRDYEYDYAQTVILMEIARLSNTLAKQKGLFDLNATNVGTHQVVMAKKVAQVQNLVYNMLKSDPLGCYVELRRLLRHENVELEETLDEEYARLLRRHIQVITYIISLLERTQLVNITKPYLSGHRLGDRAIYRKVFSPNIKPDFMYAKLMANYPRDGEEIDAYNVGGTEVVVFRTPDSVQELYHITPPEFKLPEDRYEILDLARKILSEHKPEKQEFVDPRRMREVFTNVGRDLLEELAGYRGLKIRQAELDELTDILVRYTVGFGLVEVLLQDEKVQDVTINSPTGQIPIFLVHQDYDECKTNIIATLKESESWASKLRLMSGRPLDEANPILDTEIDIPGIARARIGVIAPPLNPTGLGYAFRRHRDKPWTLPLFMKNNMINSLGAGIMSFLIDGNRTLLVAGTRSAGKSSVLGSMLVEIMRKYRIITIEDTLELPADALRKMGYNIQQMKVASSLSKGSSEVPADEGIRATLRLGDSSLIVGEVRSTEAKALYEAMRVGALANVVAGTIHGDSPYGVFDRVVNDLGVPRTSFKATDIIIVANPIKSADGLHRWRRITQITEVRKHWVDDPLREGGFVDLMKYDSKKDQLLPSDELMNGDCDVIKAIAANVKDWAGNWDAVWDNILLRAKIKQALLDLAVKSNNMQLLEAEFVILANDQFHKISDQVKDEVGSLDSKRIFFDWNEWMKTEARKELAAARMGR